MAIFLFWAWTFHWQTPSPHLSFSLASYLHTHAVGSFRMIIAWRKSIEIFSERRGSVVTLKYYYLTKPKKHQCHFHSAHKGRNSAFPKHENSFFRLPKISSFNLFHSLESPIEFLLNVKCLPSRHPFLSYSFHAFLPAATHSPPYLTTIEPISFRNIHDSQSTHLLTYK